MPDLQLLLDVLDAVAKFYALASLICDRIKNRPAIRAGRGEIPPSSSDEDEAERAQHSEHNTGIEAS